MTDKKEGVGCSRCPEENCVKNGMLLSIVFKDKENKSTTFGINLCFDGIKLTEDELAKQIKMLAERLRRSGEITRDPINKTIFWKGPIIKSVKKNTNLLS